jgi:uncharacterized protein involved in exopolysaccharide biosynthesis
MVLAMLPPKDSNVTDGESIDLLDIALVIAQHLRLLLVGSLIAGLMALGGSFLVKPTFTATAVLMTPQQQQGAAMAALQSLGALAGMAGAASGLKNPSDQYVSLMQSARIADHLIDRFNLMDVYESEKRIDARRTLESNTSISAGKKDNLITIAVDDGDPKRAAEIANGYVDELRRLTADLAVTEAQQRRKFFEEQLVTIKTKLSDAQKALQSSSINQGTLRADPSAAAIEYAQVKAEVTAAEVKLQSMRSYVTENAPEFKAALSNLTALRSQLSKVENIESSSGSNEYINKLREFKYQETLFEIFSKQYELAKVDESRDGILIQVVDEATPPERKSKPKKAIIAILTTFGSGFVLLMYVLIRQMTHRSRLQSPEVDEKFQKLRAALRTTFSHTIRH